MKNAWVWTGYLLAGAFLLGVLWLAWEAYDVAKRDEQQPDNDTLIRDRMSQRRRAEHTGT